METGFALTFLGLNDRPHTIHDVRQRTQILVSTGRFAELLTRIVAWWQILLKFQ
jgi:hypothetical protein